MSDNGAIVYALDDAASPKLFKSVDSGKTFTDTTKSITINLSENVVICSSDGSHVFMVDSQRVLASTDFGVNFNNIMVTNSAVNSIACSDDGTVVYVGDSSSKLYKSVDSGGTYTDDTSSPTFTTTTALLSLACSTSGEIVYTSQTAGHFYKSVDFGSTFVEPASPILSATLVINTVECSKDGVHVYAGGVDDLATDATYAVHSADSGITFSNLATGLTPTTVILFSAVSGDGTTVAFATSTQVSLSSVDFGATMGLVVGPIIPAGLAISADGAQLMSSDTTASGTVWYLFAYEELSGGLGKFVVKTASGQNVNTVITDDAREFVRDLNFGVTAPVKDQVLQFDGTKWVSTSIDGVTEKAYIFATASNSDNMSSTGEQEFDQGVLMRVKVAAVSVPMVVEGSASTTIPASETSFITVVPIDVSSDVTTFPGNTGSNNWDINLQNGGTTAVVNRYVINSTPAGEVFRGSISVSWLANDYDQSGYVALYEVDSALATAEDVGAGEVPGSRCYIKIKGSLVGRDQATSNFLFTRTAGANRFYELRMTILGTDVDEHTLYNGTDATPAEIKVADVTVMIETLTSTLL